MGFWNKIKRGVSKAVHKVGHTIKHDVKVISKVVKKGEKTIGRDIIKAGKVIDKASDKALTFAINHGDTIAEIANVSGFVIDAIGIATGQPEIVAAGASISAASTQIKTLTRAAKKAKNIKTKMKLLAQKLKHKKDLREALHGVADIMSDVAEASGNKNLQAIAGHMKSGANITDKAIEHIEVVIKAAKSGDVATLIGEAGKIDKTIKQAKKLKGDVKADIKESPKKRARRLALEQEKKDIASKISGDKKPKKAPKKKSTKKSPPKIPDLPKKTKKTKAPKKKRAPSKYNLYVKRRMLDDGLSFTDAAKSWKNAPENPKNK